MTRRELQQELVRHADDIECALGQRPQRYEAEATTAIALRRAATLLQLLETPVDKVEA